MTPMSLFDLYDPPPITDAPPPPPMSKAKQALIRTKGIRGISESVGGIKYFIFDTSTSTQAEFIWMVSRSWAKPKSPADMLWWGTAETFMQSHQDCMEALAALLLMETAN